MKITADTNVLVRALTEDDPRQGLIAQRQLARADLVVLTLPALCELVWVLSKGYEIRSDEITKAIERLVDGFADGVIAYEGGRLGGELFVSFDPEATKSIPAQGGLAQRL